MISRDQAKQAAESLLEPSRRDLAKRREKLARFAGRRESPLFASLFAAITAVLAYDFSDNLVISVLMGTAIGWAIGGVLHRPIVNPAVGTKE